MYLNCGELGTTQSEQYLRSLRIPCLTFLCCQCTLEMGLRILVGIITKRPFACHN